MLFTAARHHASVFDSGAHCYVLLCKSSSHFGKEISFTNYWGQAIYKPSDDRFSQHHFNLCNVSAADFSILLHFLSTRLEYDKRFTA